MYTLKKITVKKFIYDDSYEDYFNDWSPEKIRKDFGDTPAILTLALQRRSCNEDVIKYLLQQGAQVNHINSLGYTPLEVAAGFSSDEAVIRVLLEGGAEVNKMDKYCTTPLLRYLRRKDCSVRIVELLLDFKADINQKNSFGQSPLQFAIRNAKDEAIIRLLVERGADVNNSENLFPLACKNCSVASLKFLLDNGADINHVDNHGYSPLECAIKSERDDAIIQFLLENGANANTVDKWGLNPLSSYFAHYTTKCSNDIVKLMLKNNAKVNRGNFQSNSTLMMALKHVDAEVIIQTLLEAGGADDTLDDSGKSPLCIAFHLLSNDVVKMLLDAGSSLNACKYHRSALYCATQFSHSGLREDILKLLLEANVNMNSIDNNGQSVLCYALQNGAKSSDIQLLLNTGASLNTCMKHSSPLICAMGRSNTYLRENMVRLLLDNGAFKNHEALKILQCALCCRYETGAIRLLLNLPGMDSLIFTNKTLLPIAISNANCRLDVIKMLLNRKAQVRSKDNMGETLLHCAVRYKGSHPSVVNLLLKKGSPVNARNKSGETSLMLAVNRNRDASILRELLLAGALIGKTKFSRGSGEKCELLVFLAKEWETCNDKNLISSYKILAKFFLLQNPKFDLKSFQRAPAVQEHCITKLKQYLEEGLTELGKMNSLQVGRSHTLRVFASQNGTSFDVNQMLLYLMENKFPVFFDVISARIGKLVMEEESKKLQVYTTKIDPAERVYLNCDALLKLSKYLPVEDLLNFILAFYNKPVEQNDIGGTRKNTIFGKRKCGPSTELLKHPKLYP